MRPPLQRSMLTVALALVAASAVACHSHYRHEGPAQHAGREVDHALDKTGDAVEHAGHKVNQALPHD